jgi:hypothetical protein
VQGVLCWNGGLRGSRFSKQQIANTTTPTTTADDAYSTQFTHILFARAMHRLCLPLFLGTICFTSARCAFLPDRNLTGLPDASTICMSVVILISIIDMPHKVFETITCITQQMECTVNTDKYPIIEMLDDYSIITLLYEVNRDIFDTYEHRLHESGAYHVVFTLKSDGSLPTDLLHVDLVISKRMEKDGDVAYNIVNTNRSLDNIQFESFRMNAHTVEDGSIWFRIAYEIDGSRYAKILSRMLDNMIKTTLSRLVTFLND